MTQDPELSERAFAVRVVERLRTAGYQALWAGGCVRDELLGLQPKDYDVATDATPEQVRRLFRPTVAIGAAFGVIAVLGPRTPAGRLAVEVATFRSDVSYSDGRRPDRVVYSSPREDAERRDFTINGMFFDPIENKLIDYVGGQADLSARVLRAIGEPAKRFAEDKLRLLRGVRLATRFDLAIDPTTAEAVRAMADEVTVVSAERIADELRKLLVHRQRARGVNLMFDLGLVRPILPELLPMKGLPQGPPSAPVGDLWDHVMTVLERLGERVSFPLAFAALLHDAGKPRVVARTPERYTFYHHEHVGRRIASEICLRLKLSNEERERIEWLVEKHQYLADARQMRPAKLKPILIHPGIEELLRLHEADAQASGHDLDHVTYCRQLLAEWTPADLNPPPLLTGDDLKEVGVPQGPVYKRLLDAVREAQLDGTIRTKDEALDLVTRNLDV
ncbi:MAG TPA: CCA tRNA nucleotidyltransferase [Gemmataceae bacterium]|nr:CCA tRNA nucleotidyltransferase [Gemmataceae bacterium]